MARSLSTIVLFAALAAMAMVSQNVDAQAGKPQCGPIHAVYQSMTNKCTNNGASIPNSDGDPRWKPCICANGFYPVARAAEECALQGTGQPPSITEAALNALCTGYAGYVDAKQQKAPDSLSPALASATSLAAALPTTPGGGSGGDNNSGRGASAGVKSMDGSFVVTVGMTGFAAVVLATAATLL
ncbi:hypothetical protein FBU30_001669 [Linnemannia zychae]|nr:hypothetical protein FBU30_001669 [Linnemannia zychae]